MTVEIEVAPGRPADTEHTAAVAREARHRLKSLSGVTCDVIVRQPGELRRSEGKAVHVKDLRNKG
jgi:phenylacetate-CoA ligase